MDDIPAAANARRCELVGERAVGAEHLDAVVARVGDGDRAAQRPPCDGSGPVELPVARAIRSETDAEHSVRPKHLHAVVARVGDGDRAVW